MGGRNGANVSVLALLRPDPVGGLEVSAVAACACALAILAAGVLTAGALVGLALVGLGGEEVVAPVTLAVCLAGLAAAREGVVAVPRCLGGLTAVTVVLAVTTRTSDSQRSEERRESLVRTSDSQRSEERRESLVSLY